MQFEQAYQADVEITLKVWDDEIDRLVEKREKAEARIGYSCLIAVLHSKRDEMSGWTWGGCTRHRSNTVNMTTSTDWCG